MRRLRRGRRADADVEDDFQRRYAPLPVCLGWRAFFTGPRASWYMLVERATRPTTAARDLRAWYVRDLGLSVLPLSCMAAAQRSNSLIATNSAVRGRARLKIWQVGDLGCRTRATRLFERCVARSCVYAQSARKQQPHSFGVDHGVEFFPKIILSSLASVRARCPRRTAETSVLLACLLLVTYTPLARIMKPLSPMNFSTHAVV